MGENVGFTHWSTRARGGIAGDPRPATRALQTVHDTSRAGHRMGECQYMCQVCRPQWPGRSSAHCPIARRNASRVFWRARVIFDCGESYIYTQQYDILWSMARKKKKK